MGDLSLPFRLKQKLTQNITQNSLSDTNGEFFLNWTILTISQLNNMINMTWP